MFQKKPIKRRLITHLITIALLRSFALILTPSVSLRAGALRFAALTAAVKSSERAVAGTTYYVVSGAYYGPQYEGSAVVYVEVENKP